MRTFFIFRLIWNQVEYKLNLFMFVSKAGQLQDASLSGPKVSFFDWINPLCMVALIAIGVCFIYSAQLYNNGNDWQKQLVWLAISTVAYFVVAHIDYKLYRTYAPIIYWIAMVFLVLVLLIGVQRYGAKRWIDLKFTLYQPSETAKIGTLIMVATVLAKDNLGDLKDSLKTLFFVCVYSAIPIVLIFMQPDLGSALVFPPMVLSLLYVSNLSLRFFAAAFALFALLLGAVAVDLYFYANFLQENHLSVKQNQNFYAEKSFLPLKDYQRDRILTFAAPRIIDPQGNDKAWNMIQSNISVGTGGLTGKGWKESTQARLGYLPSTIAHNDFIFSVVAEEKGFIGGITVIGLFAILAANSIRIATVARDRFGTLLAIGITVVFVVHVFVNIGMAIGIMPITGIPLPFLSYGGSFLLSCCILQGIIQSIYRHRNDFT